MKTVTSIKIDSDIKKLAQEIAADFGLSLSSLINSYLRQVVSTRRIELYAPEKMTPKLERLIAEVEKERRSKKISKVFDSPDEMLAELKK